MNNFDELRELLNEYTERIIMLEKSLGKTQDILLKAIDIMLTQEFDKKCGLMLDIMMMKKEGKK